MAHKHNRVLCCVRVLCDIFRLFTVLGMDEDLLRVGSARANFFKGHFSYQSKENESQNSLVLMNWDYINAF